MVRLAAVSDEPLSATAVLAAIADPTAGGTAVFLGTVRDNDDGRDVTSLEYVAHPSAGEAIRRIVGEVAAGYPVIAAAAVHRQGVLAIGDIAVIVAVACAHRGEAFEAGRGLIDRVKAEAPIWKHQRFVDGSEEWVGAHC